MKKAAEKYRMIYVTAKDADEAKKIGKVLLLDRLVACVNIIDKIKSMYWWEGKIQEEGEALLIAKTRRKLVSKVIERVKEIHSYSCPCVTALPITEGSSEFLKWIEEETRKGSANTPYES